jgi:hypothetical protein
MPLRCPCTSRALPDFSTKEAASNNEPPKINVIAGAINANEDLIVSNVSTVLPNSKGVTTLHVVTK